VAPRRNSLEKTGSRFRFTELHFPTPTRRKYVSIANQRYNRAFCIMRSTTRHRSSRVQTVNPFMNEVYNDPHGGWCMTHGAAVQTPGLCGAWQPIANGITERSPKAWLPHRSFSLNSSFVATINLYLMAPKAVFLHTALLAAFAVVALSQPLSFCTKFSPEGSENYYDLTWWYSRFGKRSRRCSLVNRRFFLSSASRACKPLRTIFFSFPL
jgi:hypothetical protein